MKAGAYLPQHHHPGKIINAGYDKWAKAIQPLLDRESMLNKATNLPLSDDELDVVLKKAFDSITQEGRNKLDGLGADRFGTGTSIAKRHQEERVLIFRTGESWMAYPSLQNR